MSDEVKCPHCGTDGPDVMRWFEHDMPRSDVTYWDCDECGKPYDIHHTVNITISVSKPEHAQP